RRNRRSLNFESSASAPTPPVRRMCSPVGRNQIQFHTTSNFDISSNSSVSPNAFGRQNGRRESNRSLRTKCSEKGRGPGNKQTGPSIGKGGARRLLIMADVFLLVFLYLTCI